ncbi:MAG TPA: hypothetical protein VFI42_10485 [Thermomicrobiaceae bacterium]|nr:hypothetical protein [Thermomicrobiaceae bacterium]
MIKSENEEPVAIVEITNRRDMTPEVAQQIRRNMLVHGIALPVRYFLLVSQDKGYVWTPASAPHYDTPPDGEFSMREIVKDYLPSNEPDRRFREPELSLIVLRWLGDLAFGHDHPSQDSERVLSQLGFLDAIGEGTVLAEPGR